ncbi:MAG: hypothetical protein HUU22_07655 [Phycisphaerae bacterium]|nr:DUF5658 family protein [Phycisphaerae bacterium]NUQ45893.1 hypothetical protein [Phycisphaerae bacterium]
MSIPKEQPDRDGALPPDTRIADGGVALRREPFLFRRCLFPNLYTWFVFLAAMDVIFTTLILWIGGRELNWLADHVLQRYGVPGAVAVKFGAVILVVIICEFIGRLRHSTGRRLAEWSVAISTIPVALAFIQLLVTPRHKLIEGPPDPASIRVLAPLPRPGDRLPPGE